MLKCYDKPDPVQPLCVLAHLCFSLIPSEEQCVPWTMGSSTPMLSFPAAAGLSARHTHYAAVPISSFSWVSALWFYTGSLAYEWSTNRYVLLLTGQLV